MMQKPSFHYYNRRLQMNKPFYGAASMPKSQRSNMVFNVEVPGPGSYDSNQEKTQHGLPKWTLKKRIQHGSCFQNTSVAPGPGNYQLDQGFKKQSELIISTKAEKYKNYNEKAYCHSALHLPGSINLKGGASFGYREPYKEAPRSPGPIYHLTKIDEEKRHQRNDSRLKGFGGQQKGRLKDSDSPGPGSFNVDASEAWKSKTGQAWTFGSSRRVESMPSTDLGPGQYSPKGASALGRSFKLRGKNQLKTVQASSLGPGSYQIPSTKTKLGTKFGMPKQQTHQEGEREQRYEQSLSPAAYSPPRYLDKPTEHGYSLGRRLDNLQGRSAEDPGPGAYQVAHKYDKGSGGYMGRKIENKKKQNMTMDNFYKYDPKLSAAARESPKFSFPQGRRDKQNGQQGNAYAQCFYQSLQKKAGGYSYSIGIAKRFGQLKKEGGPFRQSTYDMGTIGQMPSYLKKGLKKKL